MTHPAMDTYNATTQQMQERFLRHYAEVGTISEAVQLAGISHTVVYDWRKTDVLGFKERFQLAREQFVDYLESLARKRLENPGKGTGGDILLIAAIAAHGRPEWRIERNQQPQGNVSITQIVINPPVSSAKVIDALSVSSDTESPAASP